MLVWSCGKVVGHTSPGDLHIEGVEIIYDECTRKHVCQGQRGCLSLISLNKREILYKWRAFLLNYTINGRSNAGHDIHARSIRHYMPGAA
jgi:hypothetical protein